MTWATRSQAVLATRLEGARWLREHRFVRLPDGRWTRVLITRKGAARGGEAKRLIAAGL